MILGTELTPSDQREAKRRYVYRFTGEHKPAWAKEEWKDGKPYPLQFADDSDWLANTRFPVTKFHRLAAKGSCESNPTWPNNPELRRCTDCNGVGFVIHNYGGHSESFDCLKCNGGKRSK